MSPPNGLTVTVTTASDHPPIDDPDLFDLIIVGSGSGNHIPAFLDGHRIAIVERDVFGGTCLNKGCIPSKMLIYAADQAETAQAPADAPEAAAESDEDVVDAEIVDEDAAK